MLLYSLFRPFCYDLPRNSLDLNFLQPSTFHFPKLFGPKVSKFDHKYRSFTTFLKESTFCSRRKSTVQDEANMASDPGIQPLQEALDVKFQATVTLRNKIDVICNELQAAVPGMIEHRDRVQVVCSQISKIGSTLTNLDCRQSRAFSTFKNCPKST